MYALGAVLIPLAVATALLAWAWGNLITTVAFGAISVSWSIFTISWARKISRQRDKTHHTPGRTSRNRRKAILLRIFGLFVLVCSVAGLAMALGKDKPLYDILEAVWGIIAGGGIFLFIPVVADD